MIDEQARLLSNREVAADFYLARLNAPYIAARIEPGQFVNIEVGAGVDPLLRIPLSVSGVEREAGIIEVLYEKVGPKTRALSQVGPDSVLPTLGPLGKGFAPPSEGMRVVLVGGRHWRAAVAVLGIGVEAAGVPDCAVGRGADGGQAPAERVAGTGCGRSAPRH